VRNGRWGEPPSSLGEQGSPSSIKRNRAPEHHNEISKDKHAPAASSALLRCTLGLALGQLGRAEAALGLIQSAVHRLRGDDPFTVEVASYMEDWLEINRGRVGANEPG
jgi:hypothetical protein